MSPGSKPDAARHALDEAVKLFLLTAEDMGTVEEMLEGAGYVQAQGQWESPLWIGVE